MFYLLFQLFIYLFIFNNLGEETKRTTLAPLTLTHWGVRDKPGNCSFHQSGDDEN
jgi:hypothetical protein